MLRLSGAALGLAFALLCSGCQTARDLAANATGWIPGIGSGPKASAKHAPTAQQTVRSKGLDFTLRMEPFPVKLGETRRATALLSLQNRSSHYIRLEFPTTQRFEVAIHDENGKMIVQWSEDQAFENTPGSVGINPGEHLEYRAVLGTRDLLPGKRYTLAAFIPGYPGLNIELPLVPQP